MDFPITLFRLAGSVALLLLAVHMGIKRRAARLRGEAPGLSWSCVAQPVQGLSRRDWRHGRHSKQHSDRPLW